MAKTSLKDQILASAKDLMDRLHESHPDPNTDEEGACEKFWEEDSRIETYLEAIEARSAELPDRRDLALACTYVLHEAEALTATDLTTLARLNAPALGVSLYEIAPVISEMRQRAIAQIESLAKAQAEAEIAARQRQRLALLPDDEIPF